MIPLKNVVNLSVPKDSFDEITVEHSTIEDISIPVYTQKIFQ
jgi:hypothetical protein